VRLIINTQHLHYFVAIYAHIFIASNQQTCKAIISIYLCCIGGYIQSSQEPATAPSDDEFLNTTAKTVTSSCSRNSNKQAGTKAWEKIT
jgi:hypothetical protein